MRPAYEDDASDRLTRLELADRDTATQLAAQSVMLESMAEKVASGFEKLGRQIGQIGTALEVHGRQLIDLSGIRDASAALPNGSPRWRVALQRRLLRPSSSCTCVYDEPGPPPEVTPT